MKDYSSRKMVSSKCPKCGVSMSNDIRQVGQFVSCPNCGNNVIVPEPDLYPGMKIDDFRIERMVDSISSGEVWEGYRTSDGKSVVLKVLPPSSAREPDKVFRFMNEVKILSELDHPHIVKALKSRFDNGMIYIAIPYIDGEKLSVIIEREKRLPELKALAIAKDVAEALEYAWERKKILHRNIKPSNIVIKSDGGAIITDLGLSKAMDGDKAPPTDSGVILGTPAFMSPEQASGDKNLDFRSDIYSLGATILKMVTGKITLHGHPFSLKNEEDSYDFFRQHPYVSEQCAYLLQKMMSFKKEKRHKKWGDVISDINQILKGSSPYGFESKSVRNADAINREIRREGQTNVLSHTIKNMATKVKKVVPRRSGSPSKDFDTTKSKTSNMKIKRENSKKPLLILLVVALVVFAGGMTGIGIMLNKKMRADKEARVVKERQEAEKKRAAEEEAKLRDLFSSSMKMVKDLLKESNWDEAEKLVSGMRTTTFAGSVFEGKCAEVQERIKAKKAKMVKDTMDSLKAKADALVKLNDYKGAAVFYLKYNGPFARETAAEREELAKKLLQVSQLTGEGK